MHFPGQVKLAGYAHSLISGKIQHAKNINNKLCIKEKFNLKKDIYIFYFWEHNEWLVETSQKLKNLSSLGIF